MAQLAICVFFLFISTNGVTAQIGGTITASSNCKRVQCGVNEICNSCGQVCEQRCGHPLIACSTICLPAPRGVCQCAMGFSRNAKGCCVPRDQCGKVTTMDCSKGRSRRSADWPFDWN